MKKLSIALITLLLVCTLCFTACTPPEEIRIILDMQREWGSVSNTNTYGYPQAGVILTPSIYNDSALVEELYNVLNANDEYIINNPEEVDALLTLHGSTVASSTTFTRNILTRCNTDTVKASECYDALTSYYQTMGTQVPDIGMVTMPTGSASQDTSSINIYVPDGAPALAVASLMKEGATLASRPVVVTIGTGASVKTALLSGLADIVILPTTACASLYNQDKDIKLHSVTTWGVLYLIGQQAGGLNDLVGEVVYSIGRNDTPGILFRKYLDYHNIPYVESQTPGSGKVAITYVNDAKDVIPHLKAGSVKYAVLGEPAVSNVIGQIAKNEQK